MTLLLAYVWCRLACPNMPLRLLLCIARIYEKIIDNKQLYSTRKMRIPRPVFIVLYTGKEDFPASKVLRLSGLFKEIGWYDKIALEVAAASIPTAL